MRITKALFQRIVNHPGDLPPEEGGIIGCTGNAGAKIIDIVDFDKGNSKTYGCSYSPDVSRLNSVIEDWLKKGISFCGIFHVHYFGVRTLSDGDKEYISAIMGSMPDVVDELFFPIVVMPEREMVSYRATRKDGTVRIEEDRIQVESESYSGPVFLGAFCCYICRFRSLILRFPIHERLCPNFELRALFKSFLSFLRLYCGGICFDGGEDVR